MERAWSSFMDRRHSSLVPAAGHAGIDGNRRLPAYFGGFDADASGCIRDSRTLDVPLRRLPELIERDATTRGLTCRLQTRAARASASKPLSACTRLVSSFFGFLALKCRPVGRRPLVPCHSDR